MAQRVGAFLRETASATLDLLVANQATSAITLAGTVGIVGYKAISTWTPEEVKCDLANRCVDLYRVMGVKEEHISEAELKKTLLFGIVSAENVAKATPLFCAAYQFTHMEGFSIGRRLAHSAARSITGTAACVPIVLTFYAAASLVMPVAQSKLMDRNFTREAASSTSKAVTFVAAGSFPELVAEAYSYQIPMSQWQFVPMALGSIGIGTRLAAGALTQYNNLDEKESKESTDDRYKKEKAMAKGIASTTFAQWGINACMFSMERGQGGMGILRYLWTGCPEGNGSFSLSAQRFGGTLFQRAGFMALWTHLSYQSQNTPPPSWSQPSSEG